jgi:hypothetical protein
MIDNVSFLVSPSLRYGRTYTSVQALQSFSAGKTYGLACQLEWTNITRSYLCIREQSYCFVSYRLSLVFYYPYLKGARRHYYEAWYLWGCPATVNGGGNEHHESESESESESIQS